MQISELIEALRGDEQKNSALLLLTDILVDTKPELTQAIVEVIRKPAQIKDTNRFALLLTDLPAEAYIQPLMEIVSTTQPGQSTWLSDYLFALGDLLQERTRPWQGTTKFAQLMGDWMLNTQGGEISWKAGIILSCVQSPASSKLLSQGALDTDLLLMTREECIRGIVNMYPEDFEALYPKLCKDSMDEIREKAHEAKKWLDDASKEN